MKRALFVLAATFRGNAASCRWERIAGLDALVARPEAGRGPVVVYANAATPLGVGQPAVGRFLGGLAQAGYVAIAPELPRVRESEVTPATVDALVATVRAAGPCVTLVGASTGAGLAILAAADPSIADRVAAVAAIGPFASLENVLRLATTGTYGDRPYNAAPLVARVAARSLAASAPEDAAIRDLLTNRDPARFDDLYATLAPSTRALVRVLSPLTHIGNVRAPVEIASSPADAFFPVDEARLLARAGRDVRLTVTDALEHVRPRLRPGLVSVLGVLDRTLRRAVEAGPIPTLQPAVAS